MKKYLFCAVAAALCFASCSDDDKNVVFIPEEITPTVSVECASPRFMVAHEGKVYVTSQAGNVVCIDTVSLSVEASVKVGRNPEQLCISANKLFVANSGGLDYPNYDKTVSVVDIPSFVEERKIEVVANPSNILNAGDGTLYLVSYGNYADIPAALQKVDATTSEVTDLSPVNMSEMCYSDGLLYGILSEYDAQWNQTISYKLYNTLTGELSPSSWITDGTTVSNPYKLCTVGDYIALTSATYTANGDVYLFSKGGEKVSSFPVGLYPVKVVEAGKYIYVLNSGIMNDNNASLTRYNTESGEVLPECCFKAVNGYGIGDTANDILVYGSKMYITVTTDNVVWVINLNSSAWKE